MLGDARFQAYYVLTALNSMADCFAEDWHPLLVVSFILRAGFCTRLAKLSSFCLVPVILSNIYWLIKVPKVWESDLWSVSVDLSILIGYLVGDLEGAVKTIHELYSYYYIAAGFFKLNTSFWDPDSSCATIFAAQHVTYYLSFLPRAQLVEIMASLKPLAPLGTLIVELSMGGFLALGRLTDQRVVTRFGLYLILVFHFLVCLTPVPNDISLFALQCGSRLMLLCCPKATLKAAAILPKSTIAILAAGGLAYGLQNKFTPLNWGFALFTPTMCFVMLCLYFERPDDMPSLRKITRHPVFFVVTTIGFLYSFGSIITGFQEEASPNMFANLKIHGGSNHWLVPTGLMFPFLKIPIVRVESTTSEWFTTTFPADLSHTIQPPAAMEVLQAIGGPPKFFNSGANRVIGLFEKGFVQHPPNAPFIPYTIPGIELQRVFGEAVVKDQNFDIEFAILPGWKGDETWRSNAWSRRIKATVRAGVVATCTMRLNATGEESPCDPNDLPLNYGQLPWLLRKFSMYHAYPILYDDSGTVRPTITCFGP